ncbi:hemolysin family protein [Pseudoalteromonas sp. OOF1S-7]|uniref:hemolysin family protein n=1 Tax=Pseudoalteromonas sp. OOF1S-7 TaxID=2917757 RepID=UPI0023B7A2B9|nr:hemolysin family protein [Pseudoalteromonas sp. OOF1S-7]
MDLIWVFLLIVMSAVFALCEISLAAARKVKLQSRLDLGDLRAKKVMYLQANAHQFFAAVQVVLNALAIVAGMIGESVFTPYLYQASQVVTALFVADVSQYHAVLLQISTVLSFLLITAMFVLFADLLPKRVAMVIPESIAMRFISLMLASVWLFKPVIWLFNLMADVIIRAFKLPNQRDELITRDDLFAVVDQSAEQGELGVHEHNIIGNVLDLDQTSITQAMINRDAVEWLNIRDDEKTLATQVQSRSFQQYLLCDGSLDQVIAAVEAKQLLSNLLAGRPLLDAQQEAFLQPVILLDTLSLSDALNALKAHPCNTAVVINEFATVVGMVTLSSILNFIALKDSEAIEAQFRQKDASRWLVQGDMSMKDFQLSVVEYEFMPVDSIETLAGYLIHHCRHFPHQGETIEIEGFTFKVTEIQGLAIKQIEVSRS